MSDQSKYTTPFINTAIFLSLAAGFLYLYGDTFRTSYLLEFGLSRDLFTETFEQTLVRGFRHIAVNRQKNSLILWLYLFGIGVVVSFLWIVLERMRKRMISLLLAWILVVSASLFFVGIFIFWYNNALNEGKEIARERKAITDAVSKTKDRDKQVKILYSKSGQDKPKQLMGCLVAYSPNGIAVYSEGTVSFIPMFQIIQVSYPLE